MTTGLPDPATGHARGALVTGTRAELIQVQAAIGDGASAFGVSGVPGISFREARDRVRAAVLNSGLDWPTGAITISLPPASALRHGCGLDLPIAVAVLAAAGTLPARAGADRRCVFAAELGLDGQLRAVRGLVPALQAAAAADGPVTAVIAPGNRPEARMVAGVTIAPCQSLRQVAAWLRGQQTGLPARNEPVTGPGEHAVACATLTYLAEPGDTTLGALLSVASPAEVLARIRSGTPGTITASQTALGRWRDRLTRIPDEAGLPAAQQKDIRLICPGDPEWPPQLDDLGAQRPYALWARGNDLRAGCGQAVSVVGSRAASAYGTHVATDLAAGLARRGWTIISGAAYGIDAAAHHGALLEDGRTVAVLACGADIAYPRGHATLLATIATRGTIVSEYPPDQQVSRTRFLTRNRVIAALSAGTVVVEAGLASGALITARRTRELGRPVMAVPGPVTSAQSAGSHQLIRDGATCVTSTADILTELATASVTDPG